MGACGGSPAATKQELGYAKIGTTVSYLDAEVDDAEPLLHIFKHLDPTLLAGRVASTVRLLPIW
ncbi:MAG: hypothetical protein EON59_15560 [Alphaproteobacteria bacterium]|nr:MAG: hypothetical protein EON59_15560 [Alphaproteobacteria bacterium]